MNINSNTNIDFQKMRTSTSLFCFSAIFQASGMIFFVSKHYE